jgi:hypothetical protein
MSIAITIDDPAKTPRAHLIAALVLIETLSPGVLAAADTSLLLDAVGGAPLRIATEDLPDTGADIPNPTAAFGDAAAPLVPVANDPAAAFGDACGVCHEPQFETLSGVTCANGHGGAESAPLAVGNPATSAPTTGSLPPAPPSAPAAAAAPAGAVELDKDGLPWDVRIHAKSEDKSNPRPKNADGRWRKKRGVDDALVAQVESELRALMAAPAPMVAGSAAVGGLIPPNVPPTGAAPTPPAPPAPLVPAAAPTTAAPAPATIPTAPGGAITFVQLVQKTGQLNAAGKLTQEEIVTACQSVGAANLSLIAARPDLVAQVSATIDAIVASKA